MRIRVKNSREDRERRILLSEQEKILQYKTSIILGKDTSTMTFNNIIEELVKVIETKTDHDKCYRKLVNKRVSHLSPNG
jgi:hypothetical protein